MNSGVTRMSLQHHDTPGSPEGPIGWSIYVLALATSGLICGGLAPMELLPALSGGAWFSAALVLSTTTALMVNFVRPRYGDQKGRWRAFYDFLLRQLPPPD